MHIASVVFCIAAVAVVTPAFAASDEKIDVEKAEVSRTDVDVTVTADPDHRHFSVADQVVDAAELKSLFTEQQKPHRLKYVLVTGDKVTFADLATVARVGKTIGFTVLFEAKSGELRSLKLVK